MKKEEWKEFISSKKGQFSMGVFIGLAVLKCIQYGYQFGNYVGDIIFAP